MPRKSAQPNRPAPAPQRNDIVVYQSGSDVRLEVRTDGETVWLSQAQMCKLFGRDRSVITKHIRNVFKEGELEERLVCAKFAHTTRHAPPQDRLHAGPAVIRTTRRQNDETTRNPFNPFNHQTTEPPNHQTMKRILLPLLALCALALPARAQGTIPRPDESIAEFARGVKFTVAGYNGGTEVQTNFPVLVRLSTAITGFDYGDFYNAKVTPTDPNALKLVDIGFVDAEGNGLAYDIDTWNTNGESLVWVNLPRMTTGTEFAMWYRSSKTGKALNPDNVWTNYAGVWHFREDYGPETGPVSVYDSTTNELTGSTIYTAGQTGGQQPATLAATDCNGKLGRVRRMGNVNHNSNKGKGGIDVLLGETGSAKRKAVDDLVANFSGSFWIYGEVTFRYPYYVSRKATDADTGWGIQSRTSAQTTESSIGFWAKSDNSGNDNQKHLDITGLGIGLKTWTKIDFIYTDEGGGGKGYLYKNGVLVNSGNLVRGPAANTVKDLYIGGGSGTDVRPLLGLMDEVRLCYSVPTEKRIKADYDTVNEASFLTAGMVVTNVIIERPVVNFTVADVGASHIQFGGDLRSLGSDQATECTFYAKVWPAASSEPATWTELGTGFGTGSLSGLAKGLTPATAYSYRLKVTNDEDVDSYETAADFTTSGVGVSGTGGDVTRVGDDWIHYFRVGIDKGTGGITNSYLFTPPSYATNGVRALVVAGGGPGGYRAGGGGGAGGYIYNAALEVSSSVEYAINVGTGGTASPSESIFGENGGNSSVVGGSVNVVAVGGGAGGNGHRSVASWRVGQSGGSGGGSSGTANPGAATSGQGNAGGKGEISGSDYFGGGGGGAGSSGDGAITTGTNVNAPNGGAGLECDITGVGLFYAGGGGAGSDELSAKAGSPGSGGSGVGGTGSRKSDGVAMPATQGVDGTGSGGGGGCGDDASYYKGGDGGDGIVIIRYPSQGDGSAVLEPIVSLQSSTYDAETGIVSFTYRVAWAGYGHQVADVGIAWGYSPSALTTTNPVATGKIGIGSGTVQLPKVSKTVYLRMVATNAGGYVDDSVETAVFTLFNPDAPVGTISVTDTGVTNAVFSVDVTDFGTGASSASVTVEVCESEDFTGTVLSFPAAADLSSLGSVSVPATGLANNTAYYARAIVVNGEDVELTTDAVEFSTLQPGTPVGTATTADLDVGLTTLSASALVTSFGFGSDSATVRLEVSTVSDFSTLAGHSDEVAAVLNTSVPVTATDLTPDTTYYRRVRIRNWWGIDTYVALPVTSTRSVPFSAAGPSWTASGDTVDISLAVSAVYDGAACTAVLTYGGEAVGSRTFDAAGTVTWSGLAAKADGAVAQIVVTTTVDSVDYSMTFSAPVTPGANATAVTSVTPYCDSGDNALWMRPGDVAMLPDLYGAASYQVLNERFATISGSTLTALEPGIVGIRCVDASYNTNVMGVVVLPDAIGSGSVYVFNEKNHGNNSNASSWSNPSCWRKVGSDTNDSFPQNADDIAILPFYSSTYGFIRHRSDITIGGLYAGMIRPDASIVCVLERYQSDTTRTVTFRRTDGKPVRIQVCPNNDSSSYSSIIRLGGFTINVVWASDAVIDCGSSETDYAKGPRGFFDVKEMSSPNINTNTLQGVTLTFRGYPGYSIGGNNASGCTAQLYGFWKGTGTLVKEGMGGIVFNNDIGGLSGGIVLKGQKNPGGINAPSAQFSIRGGGATNLAATVYGVVPIGGNGQPTTSNGAGLFGTSAQVQAAPPTTDATTTYNGASAARGPDAPAKGLTLVGGSWYAGRIDNKTWGVDAKDDKEIDFLAVGPGMSYVQLQARNSNTDGTPINVVTAKQLRQTGRGTLAVTDPSRYKAPTETPGAMFYAEDWADHATGAEGDCTTSAVHPVIPWIVASVNDGNWGNVAFATFDENGRLVQETRENVQITQATSEDANLYMTSKNLNYGTAGGDYTINSLYLSNGSNNRWLGEGRTLRIKSGGLILQGQSAIGMPGRTDNGALVLGDTTHPAYVWAKAYGGNTNYLGAAVTAAGGFVSAYPGNLCLVGDQTGIADEIAVNAGTLALGTATESCSLTAGVPIRVCRGAKLFLPKTETLSDNPIKLDGSCGEYGMVELPVDQRIASVAVRDVAESDAWTSLPEGTYGSSASGAEFVRDDLFAGPGTLRIGAAPPNTNVMLMIW